MKRKLKTVVSKMINKNMKELKYYLNSILTLTKNKDTFLVEGEVIEINYKDITISFTWEDITFVNCKTNKCFDIISIKDIDEIIDFFESEGIKMPICDLFLGGHCPFCDDDYEFVGISKKEANKINKECCESRRGLTRKEIKGV